MIKTKLWNHPLSNIVSMRIIFQSERLFNRYDCSNGVCIDSFSFPALYYITGNKLEVYTRGSLSSSDNCVAKIRTSTPIRDTLRIRDAIDEFNKEERHDNS